MITQFLQNTKKTKHRKSGWDFVPVEKVEVLKYFH